MNTRRILDGFEDLDYLPEEIEINNLVEIKEDFVRGRSISTIQDKTANTSSLQISSTSVSIDRPLTREEADQVQERIRQMRSKVNLLRSQISDIYSEVDTLAAPTDGKEISFMIDISNRPSLKRAVRRVFGQTIDTITYSMYREVLSAKKQLQKQEAADYVEGV